MSDETTDLSVEATVAALSEPPEKEKTDAPAAAVEQTPDSGTEEVPDTEAEQTDEATAEAEEQDQSEGEEGEQEEGEEPELPAIEPPQFLTKEEKEIFLRSPRDVQETWARHEAQRNAATGKSLEDTAKQRNALAEELGRVTKLRSAIDDLIPRANKTFQGRWGDGNIDWDAVTDQYGAEQAFKLKNQFEHDTREMQQIFAAKQEADRVELDDFIKAESAKLPEVAPDLVDPKLGVERRTKLGQFLVTEGFTPDRITAMSAKEAGLAYDAYRWRQAQADAAKNLNKPKTPPPAQFRKPVLKPGAAAGSQASTSSRRRAASQQFEQNLDVDSLVAALTQD